MQLQTAKHEGPQNQAESAHTCLRFVKTGTIVSKRWQRKFYRREAMKPSVHAVRDLGQTIKRLRLQREMTQQELADASGLDIRYIGSIQRNSYVWSVTGHRVSVWDENVGVIAEGEIVMGIPSDCEER